MGHVSSFYYELRSWLVKRPLPAAELVLDSSSPDEQPPHLISEEKAKPPSSAGGEQTHEITEDRASISSTDLLVSHVVFAAVEDFSVKEQPGCCSQD